MLKKPVTALCSAVCCLLAACDIEHTATYKVTNDTSGPLYIYKTDTLMSKFDTINAGDTKAVLIESDLSGRIIDNAPDKIPGHCVFKEIMKDTAAYKSNPTILSHWIKDAGKYYVVYSLGVTDADF